MSVGLLASDITYCLSVGCCKWHGIRQASSALSNLAFVKKWSYKYLAPIVSTGLMMK